MGVLGPMGPAGFRRRGRRRGLVVGAAGANRNLHNIQSQDEITTDYESGLIELSKLKAKNLITDEEYEDKRKQILGL